MILSSLGSRRFKQDIFLLRFCNLYSHFYLRLKNAGHGIVKNGYNYMAVKKVCVLCRPERPKLKGLQLGLLTTLTVESFLAWE